MRTLSLGFVVLAFLAVFHSSFFAITSYVLADAPHHLWSRHFGDSDDQHAYSVAFDSMGNVVMTGWFQGVVDCGGGELTSAGGWDIVVAKFDPNGTHLWSQRFGDSGDQTAPWVAVDGWGNVVVTGWFEGTVDFGGGSLTSAGSYDTFVAKFDPEGNHIWSQRFGDSGEQSGRSVGVDGSGNIFAMGYFAGTMDFGGGVLVSAGSRDIFVAKFDPDGTHLWSKRFGDSSDQIAAGIAVNGAGDVALTGYLQGAVDFGGGPLSSAGSWDVFVAEFNTDGVHLWSQRFGSLQNQFGRSIAFDSSKNVVVTGYFSNTVDFGGGTLASMGGTDVFIAKFNATGSHLWSKRFGDSSDQNGNSVAISGPRYIDVVGYFGGSVDFGGGPMTSAGDDDVFLVRLDASGSYVGGQRFGDMNEQYVDYVATNSHGDVCLTGNFTGTVDFGGGLLMSAGNRDAYVAKFAWVAPPHPPEIYAVRDVPGDQGGFVNVAWDASDVDTPERHAITHYTVWRAIRPTAYSEMNGTGEARFTTAPRLGLESGAQIVRVEQVGGTPYYWNLVDSVDAYYLSGYSVPVPTLFDSTAVCTEYHYFQVMAHTGNPYTFWASAPDSGYSVDNLAPCTPQGLAGQYDSAPDFLTLRWDANTERDLSGYRVYRGEGPDFVPSETNLIATRSDTTATGLDYFPVDPWHIKVSAVDIHGNESGFAVLPPEFVTIATLVSSYEAIWTEDAVQVSWAVADASRTFEFEISRGLNGDGEYSILPCEIVQTDAKYTFRDKTAKPDETYWYRVTILEDGRPVASFEAQITTPTFSLALHQNHPNPFRPSTQIEFTLGDDGPASLRIYDISGRLVRTLVSGEKTAGRYAEEWDGRDDIGNEVASGVYFYRLTAGTKTLTRKAVLVR